MVEYIELNAIQEENACELGKRLLNMVEQLSHAVRELRVENQRLRDENNRLKGEQGKPYIKGNKPLDREDIFALSRAIDDVLDYAYSTVSEMVILDVKATPYMRRMASLLRDAAYELLMAVIVVKSS